MSAKVTTTAQALQVTILAILIPTQTGNMAIQTRVTLKTTAITATLIKILNINFTTNMDIISRIMEAITAITIMEDKAVALEEATTGKAIMGTMSNMARALAIEATNISIQTTMAIPIKVTKATLGAAMPTHRVQQTNHRVTTRLQE